MGEVHRVNDETGGFGEKLQEVLFVEPEALADADKTRVALVCLVPSFQGHTSTNSQAKFSALGRMDLTSVRN